MAQQAGIHQGLTVRGCADRLPQCSIAEGRTAGVEAQKLHHRRGGIGIVAAGGHAGRTGAGEVQRQQLDLAGGKGVEHGVAVFAVQQLNAPQRQGLLLPPAGILFQVRAAIRCGEHVGAGTHRHGIRLGAGLDNGDVQPPRQRGQIGAHGDADGVALCADGGHLRQPRSVPLGLPCPLQRGRHVPCRQGRAVGKGDAAAQCQRIDPLLRIVGAAVRQKRTEDVVLVQLKQLFIQQGPHR